MRRLFIFALITALTFPLVACDEADNSEPSDDDEARAAVEASDDEEAEVSEEKEDDESEEAAADGDGDIFTDVGNTLVALVSPFNTLNKIMCECRAESLDFDSTEECLEEATRSDETMQEASTCVRDSAASIKGPTPEAVPEVIECMNAPFRQVETCLADAQSAHDDLCSDEATQALEECSSEIENAFRNQAECEASADEETDTWMNSAVDDSCLDPVEDLIRHALR